MLCDEALRQQIATNMEAFTAHAAEDKSLRRAAVAITVTDLGMGADLPGLQDPSGWSSDAALLLTRRSARLRNHSGQWAFPGGRLDPGETLVQAALREMHEEVGVDLDETQVLGVLDDFVTRSGYAMTPVIVWGGPELTATPNPDEVASIHRIPLNEFFRDDAPLLDLTHTSEDYIAAPTAALIYQFREVCIAGRSTRVAHFEQPEFAWR